MTNTKLFQEMQDAVYPAPPEITIEVLIERALQQLLEGSPQEEAEALEDEVRAVTTFEDYTILSRDRGLVVRVMDGSEYSITITRRS
jgi:hypothetical protein